jgi:hypothetical protein
VIGGSGGLLPGSRSLAPTWGQPGPRIGAAWAGSRPCTLVTRKGRVTRNDDNGIRRRPATSGWLSTNGSWPCCPVGSHGRAPRSRGVVVPRPTAGGGRAKAWAIDGHRAVLVERDQAPEGESQRPTRGYSAATAHHLAKTAGARDLVVVDMSGARLVATPRARSCARKRSNGSPGVTTSSGRHVRPRWSFESRHGTCVRPTTTPESDYNAAHGLASRRAAHR